MYYKITKKLKRCGLTFNVEYEFKSKTGVLVHLTRQGVYKGVLYEKGLSYPLEAHYAPTEVYGKKPLTVMNFNQKKFEKLCKRWLRQHLS